MNKGGTPPERWLPSLCSVARHVSDMPYKICLECFCLPSPDWGGRSTVPLCIHVIYAILCAALSERLLGKGFLLHFSHFLLEVMPELHVPLPHFLTRILQEPVNYFRGSPVQIGSVSYKYPNNCVKVREIIYLRWGEVELRCQSWNLERDVPKTLAPAVLVGAG